MSRPARIEIDLAAVSLNLSLVRQFCPTSKVVAVVKANAYGHGVEQVARRIASDADVFAVSCMEEALLLRKIGISNPILLLEGCFCLSEWTIASQNGFDVVVHNQTQLEQLEHSQLARPVKIWLKVDTGMHRLGISPESVAGYAERIEKAESSSGQPIIMSHFASADEIGNTHTQSQIEVIDSVRRQQGLTSLDYSLANSAAIMALPQTHHQWVRPGVMLYGLSPFAVCHDLAQALVPVMSLTSEVTAIREIPKGDCVGYGHRWQAQRDSVIATIAVGYGDGYPRTANDGTPVWINGQLVPLAGRVSMDMITVDVTGLAQVNIGDNVELWGKNLSANVVAEHAGTIGYELVTRMPPRVTATYVG